ncbi:MAG: hypothetical protein U1F43_19400 [Myxococcota bacterium]
MATAFAGGACDGMVGSDGASGDEPGVVEGALGLSKTPEIAPHGRTLIRKGDLLKGDAHGGGGGKPKPQGNGISWHGGPVMLGTIGIYYIWYGDWSTNSAVGILEDFAANLGGSPYWNINTSYNNGAATALSNSVAFKGSTTDAYSLGKNLTDANFATIVASAINSGRLPKDATGIYFVLTSADVNAKSGFCSQYCGWHTHTTVGGSDIKFAFVGNADRCPSSCLEQTVGPNGNAGADGMASIIAHEAEEAATDPDLNAWYDNTGAENADKCAWTYGATYTTANGALANMKLGTRDYLIQRNWVNAAGGYCASSL